MTLIITAGLASPLLPVSHVFISSKMTSNGAETARHHHQQYLQLQQLLLQQQPNSGVQECSVLFLERGT